MKCVGCFSQLSSARNKRRPLLKPESKDNRVTSSKGVNKVVSSSPSSSPIRKSSVSKNGDSRAVSAADFPAHVLSYHENEDHLFKFEFENIETRLGTTDLSTAIAQLPDNREKNRFINVLPYDKTRVYLSKSDDVDPALSSYINASYIDAYKKKRAFIATQGPLPATFSDFWLMLWEQKVFVVVMITNLIEQGKTKCFLYWPTEGTKTYGNITVTLISQVKLAYYIKRLFSITNINAKHEHSREVHHFQYTDWNDFSVPKFALPVLAFVKKVMQCNDNSSTSPVVVHCTAGIGRTGTFICVESLMRQYAVEHRFNVPLFLEGIRRQRMGLVQTVQQYAFIHDVLLEHITLTNDEIPCDQFEKRLKKLMTPPNSKSITPLHLMFQNCISYTPGTCDLSQALKEYNIYKNRSPTVCAVDKRRVLLPQITGVVGSNYINASYIQSYKHLNQLIITQHPLQETMLDFWRMLYLHKTSCILVLTSLLDSSYSRFWPGLSSPDVITFAEFSITCTDVEKHNVSATNTVLSEVFTLQIQNAELPEALPLTTSLMHYTHWPTSVNKDEELDNVLNLVEFLYSYVEKNKAVVVLDEFGGNRASCVCSMVSLIKQIIVESWVDCVFYILMAQRQRPGVIRNIHDVELIYKLVGRYISKHISKSNRSNSTVNQPDIEQFDHFYPSLFSFSTPKQEFGKHDNPSTSNGVCKAASMAAVHGHRNKMPSNNASLPRNQSDKQLLQSSRNCHPSSSASKDDRRNVANGPSRFLSQNASGYHLPVTKRNEECNNSDESCESLDSKEVDSSRLNDVVHKTINNRMILTSDNSEQLTPVNGVIRRPTLVYNKPMTSKNQATAKNSSEITSNSNNFSANSVINNPDFAECYTLSHSYFELPVSTDYDAVLPISENNIDNSNNVALRISQARHRHSQNVKSACELRE